MGADTWAAEEFGKALTSPGFVARLRAAGADDASTVKVFDESTPVGEALARAGRNAVVAIADDTALHGFVVGQLRWTRQ
jgi:hypothetical protein